MCQCGGYPLRLQHAGAEVERVEAGVHRECRRTGRHAVCDPGWCAPQVTVVLRNVFQPNDFEAEPALREELEADMLSECAKLGAVDKVRALGFACD